MKRKNLVVCGTRPQLLKLSREWADVIVNTGQHFDKDMNDIHSPKVDYNLKTTELGKMIERLIPIVEKEKPDFITVIGDTRSTFAGAIVANQLGIPLIHYEAGMRSYENIYEERIRHAVDHMSTYCLATNNLCMKNLAAELIDGVLVGDVEFDRLLEYMPFGKKVGETEEGEPIFKDKPEWSNPEKKPYLLLTLHRAEITDNKQNLKLVLSTLKESGLRFIWPIHPRMKKKLKEFGISIPSNIEIVKPLPHKQMVRYILHADKVVTDSGGVQREAVWLLKPTVIIREVTEHQDAVRLGQAALTGFNKAHMLYALSNFNNMKLAPDQKGNAHGRIKEFIQSL